MLFNPDQNVSQGCVQLKKEFVRRRKTMHYFDYIVPSVMWPLLKPERILSKKWGGSKFKTKTDSKPPDLK